MLTVRASPFGSLHQCDPDNGYGDFADEDSNGEYVYVRFLKFPIRPTHAEDIAIY